MSDAHPSLFPFRPDPVKTFVTLHVPTAPRTTYSTSAPDPSHVEIRVSLAQLREWLKENGDG